MSGGRHGDEQIMQGSEIICLVKRCVQGTSQATWLRVNHMRINVVQTPAEVSVSIDTGILQYRIGLFFTPRQ